MLSQKVLASVAVIALLAAPSYSNAQMVLWDQQPDTSIQQIIDQDIPDQAIFSTFAVNDVNLASSTGGGFIIDSVTTYFTNAGGAWPAGVTSGILNIFDGDGLVAGDDPTTGGDFGPGSVAVTATDLGNNVLAVTATGLNLSLADGTYWFGLSPSAGSSLPQEFHYSAGSTQGLASQSRNPGGGFGLGTDWFDSNVLAAEYLDTAITITGEEVPEPTTAGLLALGMIGLVSRRRR